MTEVDASWCGPTVGPGHVSAATRTTVRAAAVTRDGAGGPPVLRGGGADDAPRALRAGPPEGPRELVEGMGADTLAAGALDQDVVEDALYGTAERLGLVSDGGPQQTWATMRSGLSAGLQQPRDLGGERTG